MKTQNLLMAVLVTATLIGCSKGVSSQSDSSRSSLSGIESSTQPETTQPAPQPIYTGLGTLVRSSASYVGHRINATQFRTCFNNTIPVEASDTIDPGGSCEGMGTAYYSVAQKSLEDQHIPGVVVNATAVQGDTAIANYVSPSQRGQVLLTRKNGQWIPVTTVSGKLNPGNLTARADPSVIRGLQLQLPQKI